MPASMAHSDRLSLETQGYIKIPAPNCSKIPAVCSAVYGLVHYKEPLKSLYIFSYVYLNKGLNIKEI